MESKRMSVYLDPYLINIIDDFINTYTKQPRGRVISIVVSLFLNQDKNLQKYYLKKSKEFVSNNSEVTPGIAYGEVTIGMHRINLFVSDHLYKKLNKENKKYLIIAALIYAGLIEVD